jgi:hypothetical protein
MLQESDFHPETRNLTPDTTMNSHNFEKSDGARDITRPH